jgi:hypothetical protein
MIQIPFGIVIDALSHQNQNVVRMSGIIPIYPIDGLYRDWQPKLFMS